MWIIVLIVALMVFVLVQMKIKRNQMQDTTKVDTFYTQESEIPKLSFTELEHYEEEDCGC